MKRLLNRTLRCLGLRIEKHRDAYADLASFAPNAHCVVDGGCYHGGASRDFLRLFPFAAIHAFEPNPDLAIGIRQRIKDGRFTLHEAALSDAPGSAMFHIPKHAFTASLLTPDASFGETKQVTVPVTTIGSLDLRPDVIKLDLQGNELAALRGAGESLGGCRAVLCEVNFVARYDGCSLFHEVAALLHDAGLQFHRFYEVHSDRSGAWQFADALFVR